MPIHELIEAPLITVASEHEDFFRNLGINLNYTDIVIITNFLTQIGTDHPSTKLDWNTVPAFNRISISPENCISAIKNTQDELAHIQQAFSRQLP